MAEMTTGATILIVEDSKTQAMKLQHLLTQKGYEVSVAYSAGDGLDMIREVTPSLVISDVVMADMDGYQLCSAIRSDESLKSVPVMLLTMLSSVKDVFLALECGAEYFLTKPYKPEHLLSKVESVLRAADRTTAGRTQMETSIVYQGEEFFIKSDMPRVLDLLVSTYEASVNKNKELLNALREREQADEALRESEETFRTILDNAPIGMAVVSLEGYFVLVNLALCSIVGYTKEELERRTFQEITHPDDLNADLANLQHLVDGGSNSYRMEKRYLHKDGHVVWVQLTVTAQRDACGHPITFIAQIEDISDRKIQRERIHQLAYYDALTELPNRRLLKDRLKQALNQAKRFERSLAVMFLDLDRFKEVNDSLGHDAGDELLKIVSGRLVACVRGVDTVSRQGGDEFIIVLEEIADPQDAAVVARKVIDAVNEPIDLQGHIVRITTSIGIAVYPVNGREDARTLMKHADKAMYQAKEMGRNGFSFSGSD